MKQESKFFHTAFRLLKLTHSLDRNLIPLYMITSLAEALYPFITILLSARMIDALFVAQWKMALLYTGSMLAANAVSGALLHYLQYKRESASMVINRKCNNAASMKAVSLDYATFSNKQTLDEFNSANDNINRRGGFGSYVICFSSLMTGIIGFLTSLGLLLALCLTVPVSVNRFSFIVSPAGSLFMVGILIFVLGFLYVKISGYVGRENLKNFYYSNVVHRKWDFFFYDLFPSEHYAKEVRMYGMKDMLYQELKNFSIQSLVFGGKENRLELFSMESSSVLGDLTLMLSYLFVILKTYLGAVSIGMFTQYISAMRQLNLCLKQTIDAAVQIQMKHSYLAFYTDFMEKENQLNTGSLPVEKRNDNQYEIEFHDVSFHYPGTTEDILKHVSVKLDLKKRFAVVGRNGAGKTTFIKLLCRMYDVTEGCITLNGVDIRKYDYEQYLNLFAAVFQDFSLFSISVRENVSCCASADTDEKRVWDSLECAGVKERIAQMKDALDTSLYHDMENGETISGGEAQKIAIARALYKDAPFVILDEPTAALDPISEYEIYSRFDEMVNDKTSIYISHRMSSCRFCDDILVFDDGQLVQRGSHETLIADSGEVYARLWNAQAKYYAKN